MKLTSGPDVYGERFFDGIDGVTNALDNVKARMFLLLPGSMCHSRRAVRSIHGPALRIL